MPSEALEQPPAPLSAITPTVERPVLEAASPPTPAAPEAPPIELERLRASVRSRLFQTPQRPLRIGRFRVLRCIGQGGMGMVFAARDDELQRTVAIKLLRPELSRVDARLTEEAQALARLSHPNVVGVYDVGVHEGQRFIAMEYVDGCTLGVWLRGGRTLEQILEVFIAAGRGLAAAHRVGLVHRDFKPDNVLVGHDGRPRILDFGLARPPDRAPPGGVVGVPALPEGCDESETALTRDGALLGTPAYMAPEQHLGEPADARSDQFSFAVALYEAVHGSRPFRGEDIRTLSLAIVRGALQRPERPRVAIPPWLDALLVRALRVAPQARFPSIEALLEVLALHLPSARSASARPLPTPTRIDAFSATEVREVADGALLAEPDARAVLREHFSPTLAPAHEPVSETTSVSARLLPARAGTHWRMPTSASTSIELPARPSANTMALMARELEVAEGKRGRGQAQFLGESLAWSSRDLELRVMPSARGASVLLVRDFSLAVRRRLRRTIAVTSFGALMLFAAIAESLDNSGGDWRFVVLFLALLLADLAAGWAIAREAHRQQLTTAQARIDHYALRLAALAEAERTGPGYVHADRPVLADPSR